MVFFVLIARFLIVCLVWFVCYVSQGFLSQARLKILSPARYENFLDENGR